MTLLLHKMDNEYLKILQKDKNEGYKNLLI